MELSLAGLSVCALLFGLVWLTGGTLATALIASLALGSTALVLLPALGGSSPLIYTLFAAAFLLSFLGRRRFLSELATVFVEQPLAWLILFLMLYAVLGATFLPRLFAGQTIAFVPLRIEGRVAEMPLSPVTGNLTQSLYFVLDCCAFFAFAILLRDRRNLKAVQLGFWLWISLHAGLGLADFAGKLSGAGDILLPVRSATYALLTNVEEAGLWRVTGGYSEASSFGATTLCLLAFSFTYWRRTEQFPALLLSVLLLMLLILSTSSTAYVAGAILCVPLLAGIAKTMLFGRVSRQDVMLLILAAAGVVAAIAIYIYNERLFDPVIDLLNVIVFNKASSASGQERAYWNLHSLQSFYDTAGLGVGLGSSRASSFIVAVISQLGAAGTLMIGILIVELVRAGRTKAADPGVDAFAASVRACCLAGVLSASISGGDPNPGMRFFMGLAILKSLLPQPHRSSARRTSPVQPGAADNSTAMGHA